MPLPSEQETDAALVASLDAEWWDALNSANYPAAPAAASPRDVQRAIIKYGVSDSIAAALARLALALATTMLREGKSSRDAVTDFVERLSEPNPRKILTTNLAALERLVSAEITQYVAKALSIAYDHDKVFHDVVIYNELRPVFVEDDMNSREYIGGLINGFTIKMQYYDSGRLRSVSLFADLHDIKELHEAAEKAMKRMVAVKNFATHPRAIRLVLSDEVEDGTG